MSRSNRLSYTALRGCLIGLILAGLVWPSLAQEGKRGEQHPGQSQADTKQTPAQPPAAPAVRADRPLPKPDSKNYRNPCRDPQTDDESDLCQQWRMAEAAEETADWTFGQILTTGVEAVLLAIAIGIASWAGYWAKRAATATAETARIASKTAERQLRAYVVYGAVIWTEYKHPVTGTINGYGVTIIWRNSGVTPARRCRTFASCEDFRIGIPEEFDFPDRLAGTTPVTEKSHIGPKGEARSIVGFSLDKVQAAQRGETKLIVWGWIEYDDIFENTPRRRTEVCLEAVVGPDMKCTLAITGPFNSADEDCHHQPKT